MIKKRIPRVCGDVAYLPLTQNQLTKIDTSSADDIGRTNWCARLNKKTQKWDVMGRVDDRDMLLPRYIMGDPDGFVDHINGDTLDNRRSNLRVTTNKENQENRQKANKNSSTGIRGVSIVNSGKGKRYQACVGHHRKNVRKYFPYTPEGLELASQWVTEKRLELHTHSDGR